VAGTKSEQGMLYVVFNDISMENEIYGFVSWVYGPGNSPRCLDWNLIESPCNAQMVHFPVKYHRFGVVRPRIRSLSNPQVSVARQHMVVHVVAHADI
jgi:hypothetical protein